MSRVLRVIRHPTVIAAQLRGLKISTILFQPHRVTRGVQPSAHPPRPRSRISVPGGQLRVLGLAGRPAVGGGFKFLAQAGLGRRGGGSESTGGRRPPSLGQKYPRQARAPQAQGLRRDARAVSPAAAAAPSSPLGPAAPSSAAGPPASTPWSVSPLPTR